MVDWCTVPFLRYISKTKKEVNRAMEVTIKIPDDKYCNGCKFLNHYTHELVNMFGDPTGNVEQGYECKLHNARLEVEDHGCYVNVRKRFACGATEQDKCWWLMLYVLMFGGDALQKGSGDHGRDNQHCDERGKTK